MVALVVDDHLQPVPELFKTRYDFRFVEIICHHADLSVFVGYSLVEHLEDGIPGLKSHPGQGLPGLGMSWNEGQSVSCLCWKQRRNGSRGAITIDKCLRRHEPSRERHV